MAEPIPGWWSHDVVLADGGTVHLRPRRADDRDAIVDFYDRMSEHSRYLRFSTATTGARAGDLESRVPVDLDRHFAVVAELGDRVVAVASYHRFADTTAEVAFSVADDQQGRGLGTILLEHLVVAARERGIRRFVAWVLPGNRPMLQVFRSVGFAVERTSDGATVEIGFDLDPTPDSVELVRERERTAGIESIRRLLAPRTIAVVGAGRRPGSIGHAVFRNLIDGEFTGAVYPVNPNVAAVAGVRAYPTVSAIPDPVDLAVVATPAAVALAVVEDCAAKGVGGLVVITAGFAETGAGASREHDLVALARRNGMRVIGPNCMGILNTAPDVRMDATFAPYRPTPGRIAFASQSGGLGIAILGQGAERGLGISAFVSMGNKADVSSNDLIQFWEDDDGTDVILLYLESFGNPRTFARLARRIARRKPIVAVKSGRSPAGARGTQSHTASLAAPDATVDALFAQAGVTRVDTLAELFDTATLMAHQPLPAGRRVAVVSNGGGPGILAADALTAHGLTVPELSAATRAALAAHTSPDAGLRNPVDLVAAATPDTFTAAVRILLDDPDVDALVVLFVPPLVTRTDDVAAAILAATVATPTKPVVACFLDPEGRPELVHPDGRRIPVYDFPEAAAGALAHAARLAEWRSRPEGTVPDLPGIDRAAARAVVDAALAGRPAGGWLTATSARDLLAAYGIPTVRTEWAADADGAVAAATAIGYPVACKVGAADVVHKSDVGGVHLDLRDADAVRAAFAAMEATLGDALGGVVVQAMTPPGVETIVGVTGDPLFGSLVLFGMGGFAAELTRDTALRIVPLTDVDADELIGSLRSSPLFYGYRNTPAVDVASLRDLVLRVGMLAEDLPEVSALDANPVVVSAAGVVVVDAKVHVSPVVAGPPDGLRMLRPATGP